MGAGHLDHEGDGGDVAQDEDTGQQGGAQGDHAQGEASLAATVNPGEVDGRWDSRHGQPDGGHHGGQGDAVGYVEDEVVVLNSPIDARLGLAVVVE